MPDIDVIKAALAEGIRKGLTWQNIGQQLAMGAVSGLGSFAISELLKYITDELTNPLTLVDVIAKFEEDIRQAVQDIENYLDDTRLADMVIARFASDTEALLTYAPNPTYAGDPLRLQNLWDSVRDAKHAASVIDVDANKIHFSAFGVYFTMLDLEVCISEILAGMSSPDSTRETDRQWWGRWRNASKNAIDLGFAYLEDKKRKMWRINEDRFRIEFNPSPVNFPGAPAAPGSYWLYLDERVAIIETVGNTADPRLAIFDTEDEANAERIRQLQNLNWSYGVSLFWPASLILYRLGDLKPKIWRDTFVGGLGDLD